MMRATKKLKSYILLIKVKKVYPFLQKEGEYTDKVALSGFSLEETEAVFHLLQRVRKNIEVDWEFMKKGNKRGY
ncbi:hypothetical protein OKW24_003743 [Peribacillus simplex]|nr:hypothetical protein [Peribacillus simplex]